MGLKFSVMILMAVNISVITLLLAIHASAASSALYFPVSYVKYSQWIGFYVIRAKIGNPRQEFTVLIDTGSNMFQVACHGCIGCPSDFGISGIEPKLYDPSQSSTASVIGCSECSALQMINRKCTTSNASSCPYLIQGDHNDTIQGYYVSDKMYTDTETDNSSIILGCNMVQSGSFSHLGGIVDGVLGLGYHGSVLSQLSSAGVVPMMFTICLDDSKDDSFLHFGEIEEPDIVYTPLVPSESLYYLKLQSLDVNGQQLNINSSVFETPTSPGAVVSTGFMLTYLPDEAFNHIIDAIASSLKTQLVQPFVQDKRPCYATLSSIDDVFPTINLHFAGDAAMRLYPKNYLMMHYVGDNSTFNWCMAIINNGSGGATKLGRIALEGKVLVHDLVNQRFGWKDQKCSVQVKFSNGNQLNSASPSWNYKAVAISVSITGFILVVLILSVWCAPR